MPITLNVELETLTEPHLYDELPGEDRCSISLFNRLHKSANIPILHMPFYP